MTQTMKQQRSISLWSDCYFRTIREGSYLTIFLALTLLAIVIAGMLSALGELQRICSKHRTYQKHHLGPICHRFDLRWRISAAPSGW